MSPQQAAVSKEEFDQAADKVLSSKKYWRINNEVTKNMESALEKFQDWLEKQLNERFTGMENTEDISHVLSIVLIILICVAIAAAIVIIIRYLYLGVRGRKKVKEILGEKITKDTTPITLRAKAAAFAEDKKYRLSIRYSYIALLLLMHEKRLLYIEEAMTNTEIYMFLSSKEYPHLRQFRKVMDVFDHAWYGQNEYSSEDYEIYREDLERLWIEVTAYEKN